MKLFDLLFLCRLRQTGFVLLGCNTFNNTFKNTFNNIGRIFCLVLILIIFSSCNRVSKNGSEVDQGDGELSVSVVDPIRDVSGGDGSSSDPSKLPEVKSELDKAFVMFSKSDINGAKNILKEIYQKYPAMQPPGIILLRFLVQVKQGNVNVIRSLLDMTTNETPEDPEAYLLLGDIALQSRELTASELLLHEGELKLSSYSANAGRKRELTGVLLRSQSLLAEVRGRWESYGQLADKRIKLEGESAVFLRQKGIAFFKQNRDSEAANLFARADKLKQPEVQDNNNNVPNLPAEAMLSRLYAARGDDERAKKFLADAIEKHPSSREVILLLIQSRLGDDKLEEAQFWADKLVKDFPDFIAAKRIRAEIALYVGDFLVAERLFQELVVAEPSDEWAVNKLALALCEQGDPKKLQRAFEYAQENVKKNQENTEYLSTLGWILFNANQTELSKQMLQRSIASSRGQISPVTSYYLAQLAKQVGNKEEAKRLLEATIKLNTPFPKRRDAVKLLKEL